MRVHGLQDQPSAHRQDKQPAPQTAPQSNPQEIRQTLSQGIETLGKIADMLRSPEKTNALIDAIVKEDAATGQTTLNIPVPDKATVANILTAFTALLNH